MSLGNPAKGKITHVLRDGTVLDSIEGHIVLVEDAEPLYRMLFELKNRPPKRGVRNVRPL